MSVAPASLLGVLVRSPAEMVAVLAANPFADKAPNRGLVIFLDQAPSPDALDAISGVQCELLTLCTREIYVHYGSGIADSTLKIPAAKTGTARNINTVTKLVDLASK